MIPLHCYADLPESILFSLISETLFKNRSTPENLFADKLPVAINILPILMGFTMWWQQKLTPTSDPQQQKMMLMMPILFTVLFYNFPSGLSLYWTTNQVLMIVQLSMMRKKNAAAGAAAQAQGGSPLLKKKR